MKLTLILKEYRKLKPSEILRAGDVYLKETDCVGYLAKIAGGTYFRKRKRKK